MIKRGRGHCDLHVAYQFVVVELLQECLCYATCIFNVSSDSTKLPDPRGPLSTTVLSSSIESANAEVKRVIETEKSSDRRKRGH